MYKKINTIIIGGPKGLGKRNFVLKLAKFILCNLELTKEINLSFFEENKFNFEQLKKQSLFICLIIILIQTFLFK